MPQTQDNRFPILRSSARALRKASMRSSAHCPVTQASCQISSIEPAAQSYANPCSLATARNALVRAAISSGSLRWILSQASNRKATAQAERMSHRLVHREGGEPPLGRALGIAEGPQGQQLKSQGRHGRVYHVNLWPAVALRVVQDPHPSGVRRHTRVSSGPSKWRKRRIRRANGSHRSRALLRG